MDKVFVAQGVANKLMAAEASIDKALSDASLLMSEMMQAREALTASTSLGDEAVSQTVKAIASLSEARTAMVAAHADLNEAKLRAGIRTQLAGTTTPADLRMPTDVRRAS